MPAKRKVSFNIRADKATMSKAKAPKPAKKVEVIDFDTWAESGGTGGIYGQAWREGRLKIT